MSEIQIKEDKKIENLIYEIRGKQVMLDSDLARLYECTNGTKDINKAVKRNIERFPQNFCFQLTDDEYNFLRFQIGTSNERGGRRYNPYVFTELSVAMLSSVLHSDIAIKVSISIINAFINMKKYISSNLLEQKYINDLVLKDSKRIDVIENTLSKFKEKNNHIFFEGQIYDAYSIMLDIINKSTKEVIIVDNYIDKSILDILSKTKKKIILVTNKYNNEDYKKYKTQYNNITLKINNKIHDRFIIIDRNILYNFGASFKDLGNKCFAINKIEDKNILSNLLKKLFKN